MKTTLVHQTNLVLAVAQTACLSSIVEVCYHDDHQNSSN